MVYENRIRELERLHRDLDIKISVHEQKHPEDNLAIQEMKKEKLMYRDELSRLRKLQYEDNERVRFDEDR